jgi:hypothetical protein
MIRILKGRNEGEFTASIDARSWHSACTAIVSAHESNIVEGHKLIAAKIVRRGAKGGRRCQLQLIYRHTDKAFQTLSPGNLPPENAEVIFSTQMALAADQS